mmetsp:Transcript_10581/g.25072  ORF Transcript_10581/g.25072 Transcript_10581/m.25072 type:complete len:325 (+) Transcript_10581:1065-2039(+)
MRLMNSRRPRFVIASWGLRKKSMPSASLMTVPQKRSKGMAWLPPGGSAPRLPSTPFFFFACMLSLPPTAAPAPPASAAAAPSMPIVSTRASPAGGRPSRGSPPTGGSWLSPTCTLDSFFSFPCRFRKASARIQARRTLLRATFSDRTSKCSASRRTRSCSSCTCACSTPLFCSATLTCASITASLLLRMPVMASASSSCEISVSSFCDRDLSSSSLVLDMLRLVVSSSSSTPATVSCAALRSRSIDAIFCTASAHSVCSGPTVASSEALFSICVRYLLSTSPRAIAVIENMLRKCCLHFSSSSPRSAQPTWTCFTSSAMTTSIT